MSESASEFARRMSGVGFQGQFSGTLRPFSPKTYEQKLRDLENGPFWNDFQEILDDFESYGSKEEKRRLMKMLRLWEMCLVDNHLLITYMFLLDRRRRERESQWEWLVSYPMQPSEDPLLPETFDPGGEFWKTTELDV